MVEDLAASYVALKLENEILQAQVKRLLEENAALQAQIPELQKSGAAKEDEPLRKSSEAQEPPESPELLEPPAAREPQKPPEIKEPQKPPEIKELSAWKPPASKEPQEIQKALESPATQKPQASSRGCDLPAVWEAGSTDTHGTPAIKELQNSQLHNPTNDEESQKVPEYQETSSQLEPLEHPTNQEPLEPWVPQEPLDSSDAEEFLELSVPEESPEGLVVVGTATASAFPQAQSRLDAVALPLEDPLAFNGDSQKLFEFLVQLNSYLRTRGHLYPTEAALISFVGSFFSGEVGRLFQSLADIQSPLGEQFERFFRVIQDTFDNPESMEVANHGLPQLRQGEGLVHRYATRFHLIAQELNLDESTFHIQFQEELASSIQNELSCTSPATNLSDVIIECVTLEEKTGGKADSDSSSSEEENGSESPPTENQAVQATSNRPHLSEAERARRREGHLCLYCGHPGHFARDCPVKPHRAQQAGNLEARR
ncbi:retrotransposon Gag-like protein 3 isoform X3 [Cricetulus griseus]|uniref:Retrotransposon Gag-like protein 3 isoform X3 n=1 Tax=Cricetulus griseus TaxID=10029 RepID=A0A9J7K9V0_CRIGR|nr:retrotransposon Gag-like protein 3 isoform X3 [Cricetulus griseus]